MHARLRSFPHRVYGLAPFLRRSHTGFTHLRAALRFYHNFRRERSVRICRQPRTQQGHEERNLSTKRDRPAPTGTKRDILRLLAREPLGASSLAYRLQLDEPVVYQPLVSLEEYGYVERLTEAGSHHGAQPSLYTIGSAARGAVPKRYDLVLGALLDDLLSRHGAEGIDQSLPRAATRLARRMRGPADEPIEWRYERALAWVEKSLAWQTNVSAESEDYLRVAIHDCLLHEVAGLPKEACGPFFAELLGSLCDTHVQQVSARGSRACCKLKVFRDASTTEGEEG
jgi:predicted ArsR family transcriptional regulator